MILRGLFFYTPWYLQFKTVQLCSKAINYFKSVAKDTSNLETRLLSHQLHIGLGSIAYNAFKKDWKAVEEVADYTLKILQKSI